MYTLMLYHDSFGPNTKTIPDLEAQHSMVYIHKGSASVNGQRLNEDTAVYSPDVTMVEAGPNGAQVWRWELIRTSEPNNLA